MLLKEKFPLQDWAEQRAHLAEIYDLGEVSRAWSMHSFIHSRRSRLLWSLLAPFVSWWGRRGTAAAALLIQFSYAWKIVPWSCCKEACFLWSSALQPTCSSKCQFCDVPDAPMLWSNWSSFICKSVVKRERELQQQLNSNQWRYRFPSRGIARRSLWHPFRWRTRWLLQQQLLPIKDQHQRRHLLLLLQQKNTLS